MTYDEFLSSTANSRKLSAEQSAVVSSESFTVVPASAGSGKTTVLSYRFLRLVLEKKAKVDQILTLTFTRKAASEMQSRIYSILSSASEEDEDLAAQMENFESSYISTHDAFLSEIARTDCIRYGFGKDFTLLSDTDTARMIRRVSERVMDQGDESYIELSRYYCPFSSGAEERIESLDKILSALLSSTTVLSQFDQDALEENYRDFLNLLYFRMQKKAFSLLSALEREKCEENCDLFLFDDRDERSIANMRRIIESERYEEFPSIALNKDGLGKSSNKGIKEILKKLSARKKGASDASKGVVDMLLAIRENLESSLSYLRIFSSFLSEINREKRKENKLSFSDVEALALDILKNNLDVRRYYKRKFRFIMVDESQDNSPKEMEILFLLAEKEDEESSGSVPFDRLDLKKLFFVGDDKQSVYLFRGADVSLFNYIKRKAEKEHAVFPLSANYRSEPLLIKHFNNLFPLIMKGDEMDEEDEENESFMLESVYGNESAEYESSYSSICYKTESGLIKPFVHYVRTCMVKEGDEYGEAMGVQEAEYIANEIKRILSSPSFLIPCKEGGVDKTRRATESDIAVLYERYSAQEHLEKAFKRHNIHYVASVSTNVTLEALSYDFFSLIKLVLFPDEKEAFFEVLRSPFTHIADSDLLLLRNCFADLLLPSPFYDLDYSTLSEEGKAKIHALKDLASSVKNMINRKSLSFTLTWIYYESGYRTALMANSITSQYDEHFEYLREMARDYPEPLLFISYLSSRLGQKGKFEKEILRFSSNGVRLMSIHKSKGLEFPIVFVSGISSISNHQTPSFINIPQKGIIALDKSASSAVSAYVSRYAKRREKAEKRRLLYVAMTRAEHYLYVLLSVKKPGGRNAKVDNSSRAGIASFFTEEMLSSYEAEAVWSIKEEDIDSRLDLKKSINSSFYEQQELPRIDSSYFIKTRMGVKESAHEDEIYRDSSSFPSLPPFPRGADDILRKYSLYPDYGTYLHSVLETEISGGKKKSFYSPLLSDEECALLTLAAEEVCKAFFSSSFYKENIEGADLETEKRFYFFSDGIVKEGSADLIAIKGKDAVIYDYKSDRIKDPEYHRKQLLSYKEALSSLMPDKDISTAVIYLRNPEESVFIK